MIRVIRNKRDESGAISAFVVALFIAMMVLAGLVVDGGLAINARQKVTDDAEQAARIAANQVDEGLLRSTGAVVINPDLAEERAYAYLMNEIGYQASQVTVDPDTDEVTVTVTGTVDTKLMSLMLVDEFEVEGTATARPAVGITQEIP